jgi:2-polyprenyl-3-methyl-5-hydroxy-6-metoxy-1,4-benzoquinol methylase
MIREHCDICYGTYFTEVLNMGAQPLPENDNGKLYPLVLWRCDDCKLIQLSYIPPQGEVFAPHHPYTTGNSNERRKHFAELAEIAVRRTVTWNKIGLNPLIVDIGANDGTFLKAVRDCFPARLLGIEPTDQFLKSDGIEMWQEFFTFKTADVIREEYGPASVITASNVLAHVPDPHDFLNGVEYLLDDNGSFITENHDWNSIARGLQIDTVYHEHVRYFTVASLTRLLAEHDLTVVDVTRIPAHGGSFRVTAMKEPLDLDRRAKLVKVRLQALLKPLEGPVYGIGATTRATPLIHYTGLQDRIAYVCEVPWSDKVGRTIPGTRIPVVDEKNLIEDQPPYALVLSWHIADIILPKIRQAGYTGKFIIPLPYPEIIT